MGVRLKKFTLKIKYSFWKPVFFRFHNTTAIMEEELTDILDPTHSDDDSKVHNKLLGAVADLYEKKR